MELFDSQTTSKLQAELLLELHAQLLWANPGRGAEAKVLQSMRHQVIGFDMSSSLMTPLPEDSRENTCAGTAGPEEQPASGNPFHPVLEKLVGFDSSTVSILG
eukprot:524254-Pelagomonas_calceolata.AAC.7